MVKASYQFYWQTGMKFQPARRQIKVTYVWITYETAEQRSTNRRRQWGRKACGARNAQSRRGRQPCPSSSRACRQHRGCTTALFLRKKIIFLKGFWSHTELTHRTFRTINRSPPRQDGPWRWCACCSRSWSHPPRRWCRPSGGASWHWWCARGSA